jgi:rhodanese-related sulfurtransferase
MSVQNLSQPVISINADIAKEYIKTHQEGTFTILDVRQPEEYKEQHVPGAQLIPLSDLADSLDQIDRAKPVIVY